MMNCGSMTEHCCEHPVVNTLDRPGTIGWVCPAESNRLRAISEFLGIAEVV